MKRYRVCIKNAKECRIELSFPDLCVKYSNGFSPALKIKEGEEIPLDVCDPEDVRKSFLVGSLKGYLENKWIEEILEQKIAQETPIVVPTQAQKVPSQFITEQNIREIKASAIAASQPNLPEISEPVAQETAVKLDNVTSDFTKVSSYETFLSLAHFMKLKFIKECTNIPLLNDILGKTPSSQFKNNIQLRLSKLKN